MRGGIAPEGLKQVTLRTLFLRAPFHDWAALTQGLKTEFRAKPRGWMRFDAPTPVVLFAVSPHLKRRTELLMVLAEHHRECLMDIGEDPAALLREGFDSYSAFRRYWRARTRKPFQALDEVDVFRIRPWRAGADESGLGPLLLRRLYGEYL